MYDRIPWSLRNSFSSSIRARIRRRRSSFARARRRLSPFPPTTNPSFSHQSTEEERKTGRTGHVGDVPLTHGAAILDEPLHTLLESGHLLESRRLEREGRVEGDESDERADGKFLRRARSPGDGVEVESLLVVPERRLARLSSVECHRVGDEEEVLEELGRHVFVDRVVFREFESDVEPVQVRQCNPRSGE